MLAQAPERLELHISPLHHHDVCRRQFPDFREGSAWCGEVPVKEVLRQSFKIGRRADAGELHERLDFRTEDERAVAVPIIKWLLSRAITRQHKTLSTLVPK